MNLAPHEILAAILALTAILAFVNHRWLRLPESIGVMLMALMLSLLILVVGNAIPGSLELVCHTVGQIDFSVFVLDIVLVSRLVTMTYIVVVFSILSQGLTIGRLIKRLGLAGPASN